MVNESLAIYGLGGAGVLYAMTKAKARIELSFAKHRSLTGHPRMARRIAAQMPNYGYDDSEAYALDGVSTEIVDRRRTAMAALAGEFQRRYPLSIAKSLEAESGVSDMQFVSAYRVPFQFRDLVRSQLKIASFVQSTAGVTVTDLDGNVFYDLTGSYGVNLLGQDFYKNCIAQGAELVKDLGPVLGAYHPVVADNVSRLKDISGMDEVSFHMSGTEAVMQAVRLARYHTGKSKIVRFCGAYHGWWGDVQPGIGNPVTERDTYTLADMSQAALRVLRKRNDIACVLVNPLQALHPNGAAPGDSSLLDSSRKASYSREAYTAWLKELRAVCTERGIALILDEVFVGFRLAAKGAQAYFDVQADMVTYGKTLGGGLPVGVVCGKAQWMKRFRGDAPADICFARGTFNSHPYVMGAMNVFLKHIQSDAGQSLYVDLDHQWNERANRLNARLAALDLPVRVANMSSIWTVLYTRPSCYNWLFQHHLRLEGLALSWVGTGRMIFSLNYTEQDFDAVADRFVQAAQTMERGGWWLHNPALSNKSIKRRIVREMLKHRF